MIKLCYCIDLFTSTKRWLFELLRIVLVCVWMNIIIIITEPLNKLKSFHFISMEREGERVDTLPTSILYRLFLMTFRIVKFCAMSWRLYIPISHHLLTKWTHSERGAKREPKEKRESKQNKKVKSELYLRSVRPLYPSICIEAAINGRAPAIQSISIWPWIARIFIYLFVTQTHSTQQKRSEKFLPPFIIFGMVRCNQANKGWNALNLSDSVVLLYVYTPFIKADQIQA